MYYIPDITTGLYTPDDRYIKVLSRIKEEVNSNRFELKDIVMSPITISVKIV